MAWFSIPRPLAVLLALSLFGDAATAIELDLTSSGAFHRLSQPAKPLPPPTCSLADIQYSVDQVSGKHNRL
jgi:hypothetical protein